MIGRWTNGAVALAALVALSLPGAGAQDERYEAWPVLRSTFPSTGGGGEGQMLDHVHGAGAAR
jgi:hypothetical protein